MGNLLNTFCTFTGWTTIAVIKNVFEPYLWHEETLIK